MKYVIWGCGKNGKNLAMILKDKVLAYIDSDTEKHGKNYEGIPIISFEEYLKKKSRAAIIVSTAEEEVKSILDEYGVDLFYLRHECPEEFLTTNPRGILEKYIKKKLNSEMTYAVYGDTFFSHILCDWMRDCGIELAYFIVDSEKSYYTLLDEYGEKLILRPDFDESIVDCIWGTQESEIPFANQNYKNLFFATEEIPEYHNEEIEKYKGIHSGERCFIVATGPSLRYEDLEQLREKGEVCISVNDVYKIFSDVKWRPDYWCTTDDEFIKLYINDIGRYVQGCTCFIADSAEVDDSFFSDNILRFHVGKRWESKKIIPFSEDFSRTVYSQGTVTYACLQLAVYLGFKEIYLLGVDATGINGGNVEYKHVFSNESGVSICWAKQVKTAYTSARIFSEKRGISIYNATRGGELEIFTRVNFDELF